MKKLLISFLLLLLCPLFVSADVIVFKNGKRIETKGTWKENGQIKCYQYGGIVGYPEELVERIEKVEVEKKIEVKKKIEKKKVKKHVSTVKSDSYEITRMCREKWGDNYRMIEFCIKQQRNAKREISGYSGIIRNNCENKWGSNYKMVSYCIKNQKAAKRATDNSPEDKISRFCRNKWGGNYRMIEFCIKQQRAAKENIERNYSGYKRKQCENKWGNNYRMIEYCIKNQ
jgi:hypothetical protein